MTGATNDTEPQGRQSWLTPNLVALSMVSLLQDTASELLYPILPIFLTSVLGAPVAVVGMIEGGADGVASLTKLVSGRLADRRQRRPLVAAGYSAAAVAKVMIAAATVWPLVLAARVVDRVGKGVRDPPRDALIGDATPAAFRGRAFGFHRSLDTEGAVIGPLLGLGLYEAFHHHLRPLLWVAAVPAALSVTLVVLVREPPRATDADPTETSPSEALSPALRRVIAILVVFSLINFPDALLILRARHLGFSVAGVIGLYCLYNTTYAVLGYPAGAVSDRLARRYVVGAGLAVFAVAYLGLGLTTDKAAVWALFALYGGFTALTDGVTKAWIIDLAPPTSRGRALGLYQGITGGAVVVAGVWAGLAWHSSGRLPLIIAGTIAAIVAIVVFVLPDNLLERSTDADISVI